MFMWSYKQRQQQNRIDGYPVQSGPHNVQGAVIDIRGPDRRKICPAKNLIGGDFCFTPVQADPVSKE
jgi:hypothetical protein